MASNCKKGHSQLLNSIRISLLETTVEITLILKLMIIFLIIETPNFDESSELQTPTVY